MLSCVPPFFAQAAAAKIYHTHWLCAIRPTNDTTIDVPRLDRASIQNDVQYMLTLPGIRGGEIMLSVIAAEGSS